MANNTDVCPYPQQYYIVLGVLGSIGFLLNSVLIFVLWRNKTSEFRLGTSYVIGNLALADCLTGVAVLLFVTCHPIVVKIQLPMIWTSIEASLMSLMFLSVERTLAFHFPFASKAIFTVKRTITVIVLIWVFAVTCGALVHFYTMQTQLAMTIVFELCVVIFLLSQGYIIVKMQKRKRRHLICDREVSLVTRKHIRAQHNDNNVTKVVLVLIVIVVVTLLPYMVAVQIYFLSSLKLRPPLDPKTEKLLTDFIYYFYPIELLNFIVNPIIYAYRLKRYRNAFFYAFSFLKCGPFVVQRLRTFSGSSYEFNQKTQKNNMLMTKSDGNLNNLSPRTTRRQTMVKMD